MTHRRRPASKTRSAGWITMGILCGATLLLPLQNSLAARKGGKPPQSQEGFVDHLGSYDTSRWVKADGWKNGAPFDNAWLADHVSFYDGTMALTLDDQGALGEPYASGHYQTTGFHGYGCFEARFMPVAEAGVVSSFFTFAGPFDNGGNGHVNEIDIEFLGYDTTMFQANFWTNDDDWSNGHEFLVNLDFDASMGFHRYGFRWTSGGIEWFVDGESVHQVLDSAEDPTPKADESLQKIMMNVWPVDDSASGWAGAFDYRGTPLDGLYDWVRYIPGEDCSLESAPDSPPPPPPPPDGQPDEFHLAGIELGLNSRGTQAIARVSVLNGLGQPVADAAVTGTWSGIVSKGDTARTTDTSGTAVFYSARFRDSGYVTFCISSIVASGYDHNVNADADPCKTIGP